jgi:predicted CoA-binding protein
VQHATDTDIEAFLAGSSFAVAGASNSRHKYGNKVLRCYWQHGRIAYPVNPQREEVEGVRCYASVSDIPHPVHGLSLITQPQISVAVVSAAIKVGIRHFWFQPGAEHRAAIALARESGGSLIAHGPCLLVVLGYDASAD